MPVLANQQLTLHSGQTTLLAQARAQSIRVTLTGLSGEFTTIPFKTVKHGSLQSGFFEASSVKLSVFQVLPLGKILATTPEGVASLDIVFEVRTGAAA